MNKIILVTLLSLLIGCQNKPMDYDTGSMVGPVINCPVKSSIQSTQASTTSGYCYAKDVKTLVEHNKIRHEVKWLTSTKQMTKAENLLKSALNYSTDSSIDPHELNLPLVEIYIRQGKWLDAETIINELNIPVNDPLRLTVEARTGRYSQGTEINLLPQIYRNHINGVEPLRAIVIPDFQTSFELTRVDIAAPNVPSMEPSIKVSENGQNILVAWMDHINFPTIMPFLQKARSAYSSDGGITWSNLTIGSDNQDENNYELDLITAYDPINNYMYTSGVTWGGGLVSGSEIYPDSLFTYRLDMQTGMQQGPYIIAGDDGSPFPRDYDKTLLTISNFGHLWMTSYIPGDVKFSNDFGETFNNVSDVPKGMAQPRFRDDCLYLLSQTSPKIWRCDLGVNGGVTTPASDNWWGFPEKVSGTFQVHNLTYMDFHPNGDIYIIFSELKEVNSDELVIWMSKSSDNGDTWDDAWIVTPDFAGDKFLPWIEIDEQGGIHISYNDTRNNVQPDNATVTYLDMYYSYSSDGGQTWLETRVTPTSFELVDDVSYGFTYSDYNEMAIGNFNTNSNAVFISFPWAPSGNDMDMYVAKKVGMSDLIYTNGFE